MASSLPLSTSQTQPEPKVPREVFVVELIPRVTLGKLDKKTLRKGLREQAGVQA